MAAKVTKPQDVKQVGLCYVVTIITTRKETIVVQTRTEKEARRLIELIPLDAPALRGIQVHHLQGLSGRELILDMGHS